MGGGILRAAALAAAMGALAACAAQPIGTFDPPELSRLGGEIQRDLYFRPGTPGLLPGQAAEANALLRSLVLRSGDDVIVTYGSTGSARLDAQRAAELRGAIAPGPARFRLVGPVGFAQAGAQPDVAMLAVRRYDRLLVACPGSGRTNENPAELTPLPPIGCANAANLANQAADLRDLTAPRDFGGVDATVAITAVERYRAGEVRVRPLGSSTGN